MNVSMCDLRSTAFGSARRRRSSGSRSEKGEIDGAPHRNGLRLLDATLLDMRPSEGRLPSAPPGHPSKTRFLKEAVMDANVGTHRSGASYFFCR